MSDYRRFARGLAVALCLLPGAIAHADTLFDEVHTVATADTAVPLEFPFSIGTAGHYRMTLTDLGAARTPSAPLVSVQSAITSGNTVVGEPLVGAGSLEFDATPGNYVVRVVGTPGVDVGSGPIGVAIDNVGTSTSIGTFSDTLALPVADTPSNVRLLDDHFTVSANGSYDIVLTDLRLPADLDVLTLVLVEDLGPAVTAPLSVSPGGPAQATATVNLSTSKNYRVFAAGRANSTANAGLYSVVVRPAGGGTAVFSRALPVGLTKSLGSVTLSAANYTFSLIDLALPAALAQAGAVLVSNDTAVQQLNAVGSQSFTATAGTYQVFAVGTAGTSPDAGSYAVAVSPAGGGAAVFNAAEAVTAPGSAYSAYTYSATIATAGAYRIRLTDFLIPQPLDSLTLAAVQGGAVLGTPLTAAGNLDVSPAAGPLSILVFARAQAAGGLFGLDAIASGGTTPVFETTQGVGQLFESRKVTIAAGGRYDVGVTDLAFPKPFKAFTVVVTRGAERVGYVLGSSNLRFTATPGNYFIDFIAEPDDTAKAGTYDMSVATAPPLPTMTLTAAPVSTPSGSTVKLTWTSTDATTCSASGGGWTGSKVPNGNEPSPPVTVATTFTIDCTGPGGTSTATASVAIDPPSKGGGGALDFGALLALAALAAERIRRGARLRP